MTIQILARGEQVVM